MSLCSCRAGTTRRVEDVVFRAAAGIAMNQGEIGPIRVPARSAAPEIPPAAAPWAGRLEPGNPPEGGQVGSSHSLTTP